MHFYQQKQVWVGPPCLLTVVFISREGMCLVHFKAIVLLRRKDETIHAQSQPFSWTPQLTDLSLFLASLQIPLSLVESILETDPYF